MEKKAAWAKTLRIVVSLLIAAYLIVMPRYLIRALGLYPPAPEETGYSGVITLWHIVRFKPESGSVSQWLYQNAKAVEEKHYGIFFEVTAMTETEFIARMERNEGADMYSFPPGTVAPSLLYDLNLREKERIKPGLASAGEFNGALRAVPYFMMEGEGGVTKRVQFIAAGVNTRPEKREYMAELIRLILSPEAQTALGDMSLYPAVMDAALCEAGDEEYARNFQLLGDPSVPNAFEAVK